MAKKDRGASSRAPATCGQARSPNVASRSSSRNRNQPNPKNTEYAMSVFGLIRKLPSVGSVAVRVQNKEMDVGNARISGRHGEPASLRNRFFAFLRQVAETHRRAATAEPT